MRKGRISLQIFMVSIFALCLSWLQLTPASAAVNDNVVIQTVKQLRDAGVPLAGGTFIENGEALNDEDLVMFNDKMAIAIAVGTPNPWGYPPSSILDAAVMIDHSATSSDANATLLNRVKNGSLKAGKDTIWDMEFLMDNWDSWSPENSKPRAITISDNIDFDGDGTGDGLKGIVSTRKFSHTGETPMNVITYYVLGDHDNFVRINTIVENPADGSTYDSLSTGYSLGNKGAFMFAPDKSVGAPYDKYVNTYNKDYSVSLIDLNCETADLWGSSGYKDTERKTTYQPGNTYNFEAIFRIDDEGSLQGTLEQLMTEVNAERVTVTGDVLDEATNSSINKPIVVVEKGGKTFTWVIGKEDGTFNFSLPKIEDMSLYQVYALKELYSPGQKVNLNLTDAGYDAGSLGLVPTEELTVTVKDNAGHPIDARLELLGVTNPAVRYVAQTIFYSDLNNIGVAKVPVAAGDYSIKVSNGINFEALPFILSGNTNKNKTPEVTIEKLVDPTVANWYAADLHHHSNKSDGSTQPLNLVKSQLANGLNLVFNSDHDSIANNGEIDGYAAERNVAYVPSVEVSPSWAHFNVLPLVPTAYENMKSNNLSIDPYMLFPDMVKKVHDSGAMIIANHPYLSYGLFTAQAADAIPGGYSADFDFIEINGGIKAALNDKAVTKAMEFWTASLNGESKVYYLTGGSDVHDVLSPASLSGNSRTFVKLSGDLTASNYVDGLIKGNSYVTMGPLLFPKDQMFGEKYIVSDGESFTINLDAMAVNGLVNVQVFSEGTQVAEQTFSNSQNREALTFTLNPTKDTWYNIIATDGKGNKAVSNPIWVSVDKEYVPVDIQGHWAKDNIEQLVKLNVITGYKDGTFRPNHNITRAEFVVMLVKAFGLQAQQGTNTFTDTANHWAKDSIAIAVANGIVKGYNTNSFGPNDLITREQMVSMITKAAKLESATTQSNFVDENNIAAWAKGAVDAAIASGVINGYTDNTFKPINNATRAEAVTVIVKALK